MRALGIDVGTTVVKAVGYDASGAEASVRRGAVPVDRPRPGWAEQDMGAVWDAVVSAVRSVLAELDGPVDLVALTAQGDGAWLVDADGAPTGPAPLWNDGRAARVLDEWATTGVEDEFVATTASRPSTGMAAPLLAWFRDHDPERLGRSASMLTCSGWVFSRLTDSRVTDMSGAVSLLDAAGGGWSQDLLEAAGLLEHRGLLPELRADDRRVAGLCQEASRELGLPAGVPVVLAPYDIAATAIGAGAVAPGDATCILGTTLCPEIVVDQVPATVRTGITVASGAPGRWLRAFPTMAGGDVLEWARRLVGADDVAGLVALAGDSPPGARGVTFLPYLSPAGERNPFTDTTARGSLHGLSFEAERSDVARAVLEGLSMTVRDCLAAAEQVPLSLALCGGGAASATWVQLIADVCGLPVTRCADREVGARGAVLAGLVATGSEPDLASAVRQVPTAGDPVLPRSGIVDEYAVAHEGFVAIRDAVRVTWRGAP